MNSQRLLVTCLLIQLTIGIVQSIDKDPNATITSQVQSLTDNRQKSADSMATDEGLWSAMITQGQKLFDSTIGNALLWGKSLLGFLWDCFSPLSIYPWHYTGVMENIAWLIVLARTIVTSIIALEIYLIFKNRKAT